MLSDFLYLWYKICLSLEKFFNLVHKLCITASLFLWIQQSILFYLNYFNLFSFCIDYSIFSILVISLYVLFSHWYSKIGILIQRQRWGVRMAGLVYLICIVGVALELLGKGTNYFDSIQFCCFLEILF